MLDSLRKLNPFNTKQPLTLDDLPKEVILDASPDELEVISGELSSEREPNCIETYLRSLFHDLSKTYVKPSPSFFGKVTDHTKSLISELKTIYLSKADNFEQADQLARERFKNPAIELFKASLFYRVEPLFAKIGRGIPISHTYAEAAERNQKESIMLVFQHVNLEKTDNLTIRMRLLLSLYAELDSMKSSNGEAIETACEHLIYNMDIEQLAECKKRVEEGIKLSTKLNLGILASAFSAIDSTIQQRLEIHACFAD